MHSYKSSDRTKIIINKKITFDYSTHNVSVLKHCPAEGNY